MRRKGDNGIWIIVINCANKLLKISQQSLPLGNLAIEEPWGKKFKMSLLLTWDFCCCCCWVTDSQGSISLFPGFLFLKALPNSGEMIRPDALDVWKYGPLPKLRVWWVFFFFPITNNIYLITLSQYLKNYSHKTTMTVCISRQPLEAQLLKHWKWSHRSIPKTHWTPVF